MKMACTLHPNHFARDSTRQLFVDNILYKDPRKDQKKVACVASVTVALFAKKTIFVVLDAREMGREQNQGGGGGGGEEAKVTLARKPHDFAKLRSPTNAEL